MKYLKALLPSLITILFLFAYGYMNRDNKFDTTPTDTMSLYKSTTIRSTSETTQTTKDKSYVSTDCASFYIQRIDANGNVLETNIIKSEDDVQSTIKVMYRTIYKKGEDNEYENYYMHNVDEALEYIKKEGNTSYSYEVLADLLPYGENVYIFYKNGGWLAEIPHNHNELTLDDIIAKKPFPENEQKEINDTDYASFYIEELNENNLVKKTEIIKKENTIQETILVMKSYKPYWKRKIKYDKKNYYMHNVDDALQYIKEEGDRNDIYTIPQGLLPYKNEITIFYLVDNWYAKMKWNSNVLTLEDIIAKTPFPVDSEEETREAEQDIKDKYEEYYEKYKNEFDDLEEAQDWYDDYGDDAV